MPVISCLEGQIPDCKPYEEKEGDLWFGYYGYYMTEEEGKIVIESLKLWKKYYSKALLSRYPGAIFNTETWIEKPPSDGYDCFGSISLKLCFSGIQREEAIS